MTLGQTLRAAREEHRLTLDDVQQEIHIRRYLLEALENDEFELFPSPVVARGLIRNYATFLELDVIEALTLFDGKGIVPVKGQRLTPNGIEFMSLDMTPRPIPWDVIIGLTLLLLVIGGGAYLGYTQLGALGQRFFQPQPEQIVVVTAPEEALAPGDDSFLLPTPTAMPTNTPTPIPPTPTPTPMVYRGVTVDLVVNEASWIQIFVDDIKAFEGVLQAGETRQWTGERRVSIRAGNAGGVRVIVNGQDRGVMGAVGEVMDQVWEKVEDPAVVTPLPTETNSALSPATPILNQ